MTIKLQSPAGTTGVVQSSQTLANYTVGADGTVNVDPADVPALLRAGYTYVQSDCRMVSVRNVAAASAALCVASAALSNGTKSIAAQPDVCRQLQALVFPGTLAITAGLLTLTYVANDGSVQVDALDLTTALSTTKTLKSTKGVMTLTSAVVSALAGGASPTFEVGTNATLGLPVRLGFQDFAVIKEITNTADGASTDGTIGTVTAAGGLIAPTTAPAASISYTFGYTFVGP